MRQYGRPPLATAGLLVVICLFVVSPGPIPQIKIRKRSKMELLNVHVCTILAIEEYKMYYCAINSVGNLRPVNR